ncbi:DUF1793-domain-containing protein [Exidia glandulosa HHB12029]|uniref:DUF1793-domain-containing protein n=1 Tax=Exidia glandulosa HHB12029 TaxID=1314781 RepID=A0A165HRS9_EXIGL|nr:DUF1793-domain-containing protein [Exidia glandulosa HHB12029]
MWRQLSALLLFGTSVANAAGSWTSTPFSPHSVPLAVRTPYLSAWLPQGAGSALNDRWAQYWTGSTLGWTGFIRVDGKVYSWMGAPEGDGFTKATQTDMEFTSSSSFFNLAAGPVDITISFLSPVLPTDLLRLSLPFAYMSISVASTDDNVHDVQVYTDISGEWAAGIATDPIKWETHLGAIVTHEVQLQKQEPFEEADQQSRSGSAVYSVSNSTGLTFQTGEDKVVRAAFVSNGKLSNAQDSEFRAASDRWPVFAFAKDLGSVSCQTDPLVFTIGHIRDPAAKYLLAGGATQDRSSYFFSELNSQDDVIKFVMDDFEKVTDLATKFDDQVKEDAAKVSPEYAGIVELSLRQAFGACELTISKNADGSFNKDDLLFFMKEISSDGNMNTVDVVFPAWPVLLWGNPELGKYLLEPLFAYQKSGQYPNPWAVHDLGANYPKAIGHNDGKDEAMQVEESGNMIIMELSYIMKTNDTSQAEKYIDLLHQWAGFLVTDSLIPGHQLSTDDFQGPLENQTNLAIKGIIGIKSMSVICDILGDADNAKKYGDTAADYVTQFQALATASTGDHLTLKYGDDATWGTTYNLYADKLLGLNLFPQSIYDMQTAWYKKQIMNFGLQLDTRNKRAKTDWEIWNAAISDDDLRTQIIKAVATYAADGKGDQPFGDLYNAEDGTLEGFRARPVSGGHLAIMALNSQKAPAPAPPPATPNCTAQKKHKKRIVQGARKH